MTKIYQKVAKVRLQISSSVAKQLSTSGVIALQASGLGPQYSGLFGTLFGMARNEGLKSLYGGIVPGLQRQCVFASIRVGLYEPVKDFYTKNFNLGDGTTSIMFIRIASGITTGAIGITCAQVCPLLLKNYFERIIDYDLIDSRRMWSKSECRPRAVEEVVPCIRIQFTPIRLSIIVKESKDCGKDWVLMFSEIQWSMPRNWSVMIPSKSCSSVMEYSETDFPVISALPSLVRLN